MSPTLHTALEPMAFRGLLQDKEREVLRSGPGGGTYHLYEGGVQAVLGQYQGGRAGYRAVSYTHLDVYKRQVIYLANTVVMETYIQIKMNAIEANKNLIMLKF